MDLDLNVIILKFIYLNNTECLFKKLRSKTEQLVKNKIGIYSCNERSLRNFMIEEYIFYEVVKNKYY